MYKGQKKVTVAILDLDFFTNINEKIGTGHGDLALKKIAYFFGGSKVGTTAYYGSNEFIFVYCDLAEAQITAHLYKMRKEFNQTRFISLQPYEKTPLRYSMGASKISGKIRTTFKLLKTAGTELNFTRINQLSAKRQGPVQPVLVII